MQNATAADNQCNALANLFSFVSKTIEAEGLKNNLSIGANQNLANVQTFDAPNLASCKVSQ
jgi:hypothetical protein